MEYKPLSGREFPRFSAIKTFFRLPNVSVDADYDLAIFGTPFDGGVSYRPGARFAPSAVREASSLGRAYHLSRGINIFEKLKIADIGDCPTVPIDLPQSYSKIEQFARNLLNLRKSFLSVGGDHSTTLPLLRAARKHLGRPLGLVHFDAHLDTYPAAWGCEYHHGSFARHAVEEGLVDPGKMVQIGIRGPLAGGDDLDFVRRHGITVITVDDIREKGIAAALSVMPSFVGIPVHLSFDIDCLDPAYAPGTGTPVPGGLTTWEAQKILRSLRLPELLSADVVEVSPPFDHASITALAAVDAIFQILALFAGRNS
ncbi:MAG: agmatinase [Bdellovibrionaceae bacterium]|nr:agmatinase [Pseudobdellovibrionaceae bacterium]